jgi:hypothetical protein
MMIDLTFHLEYLSRFDAANGQEVILKLEERIGETSQFREYKSARYTLRRSFISDFDL